MKFHNQERRRYIMFGEKSKKISRVVREIKFLIQVWKNDNNALSDAGRVVTKVHIKQLEIILSHLKNKKEKK